MKLPNIEKNAFLSIFVNNQKIYANLAYIDYNSGRNYVLHDVTDIYNDISIIYTDRFWEEYFEQLKEVFNWEFFRGKQLLNIVAEGIGVGTISINLSTLTLDVEKLIPIIRSISYDINVIPYTYEKLVSCVNGITEKMDYEDVVVLNLDLFRFDIYRSTRQSGGKKLNVPNGITYNSHNSHIAWNNAVNLVANINNSKLKAFISHDISNNRISNIWANFISNPFNATSSEILQDIIRSYITVQLLTILNENEGKFEGLGQKSPSTLIIVTGGLIKNVNESKLLLSLIDGLELRGEVDILLDTHNIMGTFVHSFVEGINSNEFVFSNNDIFNGVYKLFVPEVGNDKGRKVIFTGKLESLVGGIKDLATFSQEITSIPLNNCKEFVTGKFVQGTFWGNKYESFELYSDPKSVTYSKLIIDGRSKPVVYGPDARANRFKISQWIDENN